MKFIVPKNTSDYDEQFLFRSVVPINKDAKDPQHAE
jgi:hypothetical protein